MSSESQISAALFSPRYPFLTLAGAHLLLRVACAVFFMAHALVRIVTHTIPGFGEFLEVRGWPQGLLLVWLITLYELTAGTMIALGRHVQLFSAGLIFIATMGIVIIHAQLGWFVGEHGVGGMEYSVSLIVSLLVLAAADAEKAAKHASTGAAYG
jgi:putative oxidoreductase